MPNLHQEHLIISSIYRGKIKSYSSNTFIRE